jgi:hypothetical protein
MSDHVSISSDEAFQEPRKEDHPYPGAGGRKAQDKYGLSPMLVEGQDDSSLIQTDFFLSIHCMESKSCRNANDETERVPDSGRPRLISHARTRLISRPQQPKASQRRGCFRRSSCLCSTSYIDYQSFGVPHPTTIFFRYQYQDTS